MALKLRNLVPPLSLCFVLLFPFSVNAQWEYNWLIGLSGGFIDRDGSLDLAIFHQAGELTTLTIEQEDSGFFAGLFAGYQARCNKWLVGAEIKVDWQDLGNDRDTAFTDALGNGIALSSRYRQTNIVELSGRLGYEVYNAVMPYARLGFQTSRDRLTVSAADPSIGAAEIDDQHRVYRLLTGVGVEMPIPVLMGLSFRMEYNYLPKGGRIDGQSLAPDNVTVGTANIRPHLHQTFLALVLNLFQI